MDTIVKKDAPDYRKQAEEVFNRAAGAPAGAPAALLRLWMGEWTDPVSIAHRVRDAMQV